MMPRIVSLLRLPPEVSGFEREHLARTHRVAWWFFAAHVPIFTLLAWANRTGPLKALALTLLALVGPALARRGAVPPRAASMVFGFTAMCMGALLTHFGQGPMQIEMHFYFFVLIALLAVFGHPATVLVAAATVAAHHLTFWALLPRSVFNYDAPVWAVAVHALFVVLESAAACYVARAFFDNVIGLERVVEARTRDLDARNAELALILDHADQGFLLLDAEGRVAAARSACADAWLGHPAAGVGFGDALGALDARAASWFDLGWSQLVDGVLPEELALDQLPRALAAGDRSLGCAYRVLRDGGGAIERVMVVLTDRTDEIARERAEVAQQELMALFTHLQRDRSGVRTFLSEGDAIVSRLEAREEDPRRALREVHTLKGNAGLYGARSVAEHCHGLEEQLGLESRALEPREAEGLASRWREFRQRVAPLTDEMGPRTLVVEEQEVVALSVAVAAGVSRGEVVKTLASWRHEPAAVRLEALGEQIRALARRLGRCEVEAQLQGGGVRLPARRWSPFWAALAHVARNAADHGFETTEERVARGKAPVGRVLLRATTRNDRVLIEVSDDGRGVDWSRVAERCARLGLAHESRDDLVRALFSDGLSTRDDATEHSGRGAGMSAVYAATRALGGTLDVVSEPDAGTTVRFEFPRPEVEVLRQSSDEVAARSA